MSLIFFVQLGIATALWFLLYYSPQDIAYNVKHIRRNIEGSKCVCWKSSFLTWSLKMSKMFPVRLCLYCIKGLYYPKKVQKQILISKRRFASNWVIKPPKVTQGNTGVGRDEAREARPPRQLPRHDPYRLLQGQVEISLIPCFKVVTFCCAELRSKLKSHGQLKSREMAQGSWSRFVALSGDFEATLKNLHAAINLVWDIYDVFLRGVWTPSAWESLVPRLQRFPTTWQTIS